MGWSNRSNAEVTENTTSCLDGMRHTARPSSCTSTAITAPATPSHRANGPLIFYVFANQKYTRNIFGLFRHYRASHFPEHDPDEDMTSEDLMDTYPGTLPEPLMDSFHPYPNHSSFFLGEWYWNDGAKKSQSSFKNLLQIVGDPDFRPEDVGAVNWKCIDAQLRANFGIEDDRP